jgi:hypothetical protein
MYQEPDEPGLGSASAEAAVDSPSAGRCVVDLTLRGVQIGTGAGVRELEHQALANFWAAAEEFGTLVIIRPWGGGTPGERLAAHYLANNRRQSGGDRHRSFPHRVLRTAGPPPGPRHLLGAQGGYLPAYLGRSGHALHVRPRRAAANTRPVLGAPDPVDRVEAAGLNAASTAAIISSDATRLLQRASGSRPPGGAGQTGDGAPELSHLRSRGSPGGRGTVPVRLIIAPRHGPTA